MTFKLHNNDAWSQKGQLIGMIEKMSIPAKQAYILSFPEWKQSLLFVAYGPQSHPSTTLYKSSQRRCSTLHSNARTPMRRLDIVLDTLALPFSSVPSIDHSTPSHLRLRHQSRMRS